MKLSECCCLPRHPAHVPRSGAIVLNIGGVLFTTCRETLSKCPKLLDLTTSCRPGPGGVYFIDRDGQCYSEVLNFLRDGPDLYVAPFEEDTRRALDREAIFLELPALADCLRQPPRGAPLPAYERARLERLKSLDIMHTDEHEDRFDNITRVLAATLDVPITFISLVGSTYEWFKSRVGLRMSTASREASFCAFTFPPTEPWTSSVLVITDARSDPRVSRNQMVLGYPHIVFFAGCPLVTSDGLPLGALCASDCVPRTLSRMQAQLMLNFGQIVAQEIEREELLALKGDVQELSQMTPPCPADFTAGPLRQQRMRDALLEAVCLVSARLGSMHWPILYANRTWTELSGIRITPPLRLPGEAVADGVGLSHAACGRAAESGLSFWDWLRLADKEDRFLRWMRKVWERAEPAIFALDGTAPVVPGGDQAEQDGGAERMSITCRFTACKLPLDVASPVFSGPDIEEDGGDSAGEAPSECLYFVTMVRTSSSYPGHPRRLLPASGAGAGAQASSSQEGEQCPFPDVRLMRLVGKGSFGKVYYALWMGTPVAVKVLKIQAENQTRLLHPNIVRTYKYEDLISGPELSSETWVVQEWCDLGTLGEFCNRPRDTAESIQDVLGICSDVAGGGSYLHAQGIIHGDLTANNVLIKTQITRRGYVCKICDFGLAQVVEACSAELATSKLSTVSHLPPEVLDAQETQLTAKADVYAAGILLWQAMRGESPFCGLSPQRVIVEVASGRRLQLPENTPKAVRDVFDRCTSPDPAQRPSFNELVQIFSGPLGAAAEK